MNNTSDIFKGLNEEERLAVNNILKDMSITGTTDRLTTLYSEDWEEIPVDIDTFLTDRQYLGNFTDGGKELTYRKWPETFRDLFPNPMKQSPYIEVALTGGIGLGKSTNADYALVYCLYRDMCLKNPNKYYGQPASTIWFCWYNNTLDSATSAAYGKFQAMIQSSPWFMERGKIYGTKTKEYIPDKNIRFKIGSELQHTLGLNIKYALVDEINFKCLSGNTEVLTSNGIKKIEDLEGDRSFVYSVDNNGNTYKSNEKCLVKNTLNAIELIEIELEDGSILRCTPDHRFMLKDGTYKEAQYLTEEDELMEKEMYGYIYMTSFDNGRYKYIGKRKSNVFLGTDYLGSGGDYFQKVKNKYLDTAEVKMIDACFSEDELNEKEKYWINKYNAVFDSSFLNVHEGGKGGYTTKGYTEQQKKEYGRKISESKKGKTPHFTEESKKLRNKNISKALKGKCSEKKLKSLEENRKHFKHHSEETKQRIRNSLIGPSGRKGINNGTNTKFVKQEELDYYLKNGWMLGQLRPPNIKSGYKKGIKHWYNNGIENKLISEEEFSKLDSSWKSGRINSHKKGGDK